MKMDTDLKYTLCYLAAWLEDRLGTYICNQSSDGEHRARFSTEESLYKTAYFLFSEVLGTTEKTEEEGEK